MIDKQTVSDFVLGNVIPGREDDARALLDEGWARYDGGTFDNDYLEEMAPRYRDVIKPEHHSKIGDFFRKEFDLLNRAGDINNEF